MKKFIKIFLLVVFCSLSTTINLIKAETKSVVVNEIIIKNNQRIDSETILSYLNVYKGDKVNYQILNKKLKEMYALGLFADIKFRVVNNDLIILIKENPMINNINFSGNKKVKDETINQEIKLKSRNVFQKKELRDAIETLRELYKRTGFFSAVFKPKIINLSQNRVDINIKIIEGKKTKIKGIKFVGNKIFSEKRLKGIVSTKESKLYRILSAGDIYDPDRINYDKDLLRRFYLKEGYADFQIKSVIAEISKNKNNFYITYNVSEGNRYKFGEVSAKSANKSLSQKKLDEITDNLNDSTYNIDALDEAINDIKVYAGNQGFAFVRVTPQLKRDPKESKINVIISVSETKKVYVGRVNIAGNSRTEDRVIRREFRFNEGDSFSTDKLRRSQQRIRNTGFFENVDVERRQIDRNDRVDLDVKVIEKQTGQFSVGGGFSSTNGAIANVGIAEKNFLGKGQDLRLKLSVAERQDEIDLSFTEPYFRGKNIALGTDIYKVKTTYADESSYDSDNFGAAIRVGYMITEKSRHMWNYLLKQEEIEGIKSQASDFINNQKGSYTTSAVSHTLSFFGFDDRLNPSKGTEWKLQNTLAGIGGNVYFFSTDVKLSKYIKISDGYIFGTKLNGGYIFGYNDDDVGLKDRYFLGGDSFVGFETSGIGPRDTTAANKDALGGNLMYTGELDLKIPIPGIAPQLGINGRFFGKAGAVTEIDENGGDKIKDNSNPRVSAGFGVQWKSPFGPVSVDFAYPVMKEDFDRTQMIKFGFGARF